MQEERFSGFGPNAINWFLGLQQDNSKTYFEAHRSTWQREIREPLEMLMDEAAAQLGGSVKLFRPNRDVRFSSDKSPYKTNSAALLKSSGMDGAKYVSLDSSGLYAGTGFYEMAKDQLERFREAVATESSGVEFVRLLTTARGAGLTVEGEQLKTAPRGYAKDHPRVELLKFKGLVLGSHLPPTAGVFDRRAFDHVLQTWALALPAIEWLQANVGPSSIPPKPRFGPS